MMKTSRLMLIAVITILLTSSCKIPFLSWLQGDDSQPVETEITEGDASTSDETEDTDRLIPHNTDGAEVTYIPGATYLMGSSEADPLAEEDEFPQHPVEINEFFIYTYEVTNQMYAKCVEAGDCVVPDSLEVGPTSHYEDPEFAEYPIVGVDWVMARDYCTWAGVRLPTAAEWELAARGPDSLIYPWGEAEPTCEYTNMKDCYSPPDTQEIGFYLLGNSPDEVWDMSGNVWEWVQDWYGEDYYNFSPQYNPIGPYQPADPDNPLRVIRGGGFNSDLYNIRSATRKGMFPYRSYSDVGFRCVVGEELDFPPGYDHGEDRHDRVPPDRVDGGITSVSLLLGCRNSEIVDLGIMIDPADAPFEQASNLDGPLACIPFPPPEGVYKCEDIHGVPHVMMDIEVSFSDRPPITGTVEYPDCSVPFWIDHFCDVDETGAIIPYLRLHYPSGGPVLVGAAATALPDPAVDLDCIVTAPGLAVCHDLPGVAGASWLAIFAEFDDGTTEHGEHSHPLCPDLDGFEPPPWDLRLSCIPHVDSAEYRATIETNMAGADFIPGSWTLTGAPPIPEPKSCTLEDPDASIWGCNFPIGAYTEMEFCAEWVGGSGPHCLSYVGAFPPDCTPPPEDDDGGGDPEMGWCRPGAPPANCSGPCMATCPVGVNCNPCTMP